MRPLEVRRIKGYHINMAKYVTTCAFHLLFSPSSSKIELTSRREVAVLVLGKVMGQLQLKRNHKHNLFWQQHR